MHLCLRCPNINKRLWYSRKDACRKALTGIQRVSFLWVFMHVYTHICLFTTPKEKLKVAMGGEGVGTTKKERKMYFLSNYHGRKRNLRDMSKPRNVRELPLLYYPTFRGDDDTMIQAHTLLTPANTFMGCQI